MNEEDSLCSMMTTFTMGLSPSQANPYMLVSQTQAMEPLVPPLPEPPLLSETNPQSGRVQVKKGRGNSQKKGGNTC